MVKNSRKKRENTSIAMKGSTDQDMFESKRVLMISKSTDRCQLIRGLIGDAHKDDPRNTRITRIAASP